jgi:FecR-like protein
MRHATCSRIWEAEAARDGRLSASELERFELHCRSCAICQGARATLRSLGADLRAADPAVEEIAVRRLRYSLLRRADAALKTPWVARSNRRNARVAFVAASALLAVGLSWRVWWGERLAQEPSRDPSASSSGNAAAGEPGYEALAEAEPGTVWQRRRAEGIDEIRLSEGALSIAVRHAASAERRMVVRVPDGQVLDTGTRFRVAVSGGRTTDIRVSEGAVVFQRPGQPDVRVDEGSSWSAEVGPAAQAEPSAVHVMEPAPSGAAARMPEVAHPRSDREGKHAVGRGTRSAQSETDGAEHPSAEDAAYLRWIALLRAGRREEARAAGLDYLRRFPEGFRRGEVESVVAPRPFEVTSKP